MNFVNLRSMDETRLAPLALQEIEPHAHSVCPYCRWRFAAQEHHCSDLTESKHCALPTLDRDLVQ
jgi:hypothetical protein